MKHMEEDQGARLVRCVLGVLLGGGVALLACFLFLLLASVGISNGWIGEQLMYQMTIVGCVIGGFSGGTAAIRHCRSRALIVGLLTGCVFFLILLTVGVLFFGPAAPEEGLALLCGALCGGAAAGLLGGKRPARKKRKARR